MKNENSLKTTNITAEQQAFNDMLKYELSKDYLSDYTFKKAQLTECFELTSKDNIITPLIIGLLASYGFIYRTIFLDTDKKTIIVLFTFHEHRIKNKQ